jgi:hypothetical protein
LLKIKSAFTTKPAPHFNYPAPLRSASLHQQQRNEIMKNFRYAVNRFLQLPEPARFAESLATAGSPASRAPLGEARKSEILASPTTPCKRYFNSHELRQKRRKDDDKIARPTSAGRTKKNATVNGPESTITQPRA